MGTVEVDLGGLNVTASRIVSLMVVTPGSMPESLCCTADANFAPRLCTKSAAKGLAKTYRVSPNQILNDCTAGM